MSSLFKDPEYRLEEGFALAYLNLLKCIKDNDLSTLGHFTERNLYRAIADGLQEVNRDVEKIEILNEDEFPENVNI